MILMIQQGNFDAFDQIFEKYKNEAVRTAYLITGRKSICEDIAQEAFIKCFKHISDLKNPNGFRAWFFRILTRTAWKYGRSASREIPTENMAERVDESSLNLVNEQYSTFEENRLLYSEINHLEPKQKTVIILYYFNGLSTKEIAKVSRCLEGTVKSRLFSARKKLKSRLDSVYHSRKECKTYAEHKVI
ncbi:RNA polymerase sigma factor [Caproiciproducens sp.]|uniref:RNA polymerase sigma factor n=1 Tax=Caproiciproducens sp. TaxID=1954376 RepID=UPI0028A2C219|nr:RNA polymerase sigma factor [Caproiciproducens sp.]MEA4830835.1 RNA polymerase sigma factor [Enterococcus thailandicus]